MAPELSCAVCGEPVEEVASAVCGVCDRHFHLNQRNDVEGRDCGEVWIDEQYLSLRFACVNCLGRATIAGEPPVGSGH